MLIAVCRPSSEPAKSSAEPLGIDRTTSNKHVARGADVRAVMDLLMRVQEEAPSAGGEVIICVQRFDFSTLTLSPTPPNNPFPVLPHNTLTMHM